MWTCMRHVAYEIITHAYFNPASKIGSNMFHLLQKSIKRDLVKLTDMKELTECIDHPLFQ